MILFLNLSAKMNKHTYRQRFTLIEMLIVVGIASLLFALLGPAFTRMTQSRAVEQHASGLKLGMERARALAVSQRRYVAMLLPDKKTNDAEIDKFRYGGFRYAYVTEDNTGENPTDGDKSKCQYFLEGWIPGEEWCNRGKNKAHLVEIQVSDKPEKAKEDNTTQITEDYDKNFVSKVDKDDESAVLTSVKIKNHELPALIFTPYGDIKTNSDNVELYFYVCGEFFYDRIKIRLNKLSGKVEYID